MKKILTGLAIAAALGFVALAWLAGLGKEDVEQLGRGAYYKARGAAGSLKGSPESPGNYAHAEQCRANLREIERAKRVIAQRTGMAHGAFTEKEIADLLGGFPNCPSGGKYTMGAAEYLPSCSIGANANQDPGDDHVLRQY